MYTKIVHFNSETVLFKFTENYLDIVCMYMGAGRYTVVIVFYYYLLVFLLYIFIYLVYFYNN